MPQRVIPAERGIVLDSLSAGYGQTLIVDDIHLTIPHGKMTVLAGANGSGKSTLLSTIARMLKPLGGSVRLDGQMIHPCRPGRFRVSWGSCRSLHSLPKD
jgi:iron complex transport system ATP-binding protein